MKKLAYLSLLLLGVSFASCKKCATCTSEDNITTEICDKGRVYNNTIYQYERNNWTCVEN